MEEEGEGGGEEKERPSRGSTEVEQRLSESSGQYIDWVGGCHTARVREREREKARDQLCSLCDFCCV